jgi:hypothetical protein
MENKMMSHEGLLIGTDKIFKNIINLYFIMKKELLDKLDDPKSNFTFNVTVLSAFQTSLIFT